MKKVLFVIIAAVLLGACSIDTQQGTVVVNFCDMDSEYIDCPEIELSQSVIKMKLAVKQDVAVDSIVFELPNPDAEGNPVYCSTDANSLTSNQQLYSVNLPCDLSSYDGQNTQLNFVVTMTTADGTVAADGQAEDYVE